jgi:Zn finger protein HypA/HybF involved in hydrogenase expression
MHEISSVETLVHEILHHTPKDSLKNIRRVSVRIDGTFVEEAVRHSFEVLSRNTPLEGVPLAVCSVVRHVQCACGRTGDVSPEDLVNYIFMCPSCGALREMKRGPELELLEVVFDDSPKRS